MKTKIVEGRLRRSPRGHARLQTAEGHYFVSARELGSFVDGDQVRGQVQTAARGRLQVVDLHLLQRRQSQLAGTLRKAGRTWILEADDGSFGDPILLVEHKTAKLRAGLVVAVELLELADPAAMQRGRFLRVLGFAGSARAETERLLINRGIRREHPQEVQDSAACFAAAISQQEIDGRDDLRRMHLVTIDGEDARDFDDAIHVSETEQGFVAHVAIADVAHYVRASGVIDEEAARRATSVYWPGGVAHMLPQNLAAGLCSLRPDEDRLVLVCELRYDASAQVQKTRVFSAIMRSAARLTYTQVNAAFAEDAQAISELGDSWAMLQVAGRLTALLAKDAEQAGRLHLDIPEPVFELDDDGEPLDAHPSHAGPAQKLIEHLMIAANEAVARHFREHQLPGLFRVHESPSEEKIQPFVDASWALNQRAVDLTKGAQAINASIAACKGPEDRKLLSSLLLRCLPRAAYAPEPLGHFGLALQDYLHFTSPIRRYPDLLVHRALKADMAGNNLEKLREALPGFAEQVNAREREAMELERMVDAMLAARMMQAHIGEDYQGSIGGIGPGGLYVSVAEPMFEGYVRAELLQPEDYYSLSEDGLSLIGQRSHKRFRIGTGIKVRILQSDPLTRQIDLDMLELDDAGQVNERSLNPRSRAKAKGKSRSQAAANSRRHEAEKSRYGQRRRSKNGKAATKKTGKKNSKGKGRAKKNRSR